MHVGKETPIIAQASHTGGWPNRAQAATRLMLESLISAQASHTSDGGKSHQLHGQPTRLMVEISSVHRQLKRLMIESLISAQAGETMEKSIFWIGCLVKGYVLFCDENIPVPQSLSSRPTAVGLRVCELWV